MRVFVSVCMRHVHINCYRYIYMYTPKYVYIQIYLFIHLFAKTILETNAWQNLMEVGAWRQWMDIAATSASRLFFFLPPARLTRPQGFIHVYHDWNKAKYCGQMVYQCLSLVTYQCLTSKKHLNKTAVKLVDVYCNDSWSKLCGSTKFKRGPWETDVIQKNHRFLMTRPWHLCSLLEVPVRWQWGMKTWYEPTNNSISGKS